MFIVPPGRGASKGPLGPQSSAAARAVPSPASTTSRSGPASIADLRQALKFAGSGVFRVTAPPNSDITAASSSAVSGPTLPAARLTTTWTLSRRGLVTGTESSSMNGASACNFNVRAHGSQGGARQGTSQWRRRTAVLAGHCSLQGTDIEGLEGVRRRHTDRWASRKSGGALPPPHPL